MRTIPLLFAMLLGCDNTFVDLGDEGCPWPDSSAVDVGEEATADAGADDAQDVEVDAQEDDAPSDDGNDGEAAETPRTCNPEACAEVCYTAADHPLFGGCYTIKDGCWWCHCMLDDGTFIQVDDGAGCP